MISVLNARNQDTPHDTALTSDAMNAKNMDIQSWIALTKYHLQAYQHNITRCIETATPGQVLDTAKKIEKGETVPDHTLGIADIAAPATMTCTEAAVGHNKGMGTAATEAAEGYPIHHTEATVTEPAMRCLTNHTTDHPHTTAHQVTTLRTAVNHVHAHPRSSKYNPHHRGSHS